MEQVLLAACLLSGFSATCICLEGIASSLDLQWKRVLLRSLGAVGCGLLLLDAFSSGGFIERSPCIDGLEPDLAQAYGVVDDPSSCLWVDDCTLVLTSGGKQSFGCRGASQSIDTMLLVTAVANAAMLASL